MRKSVDFLNTGVDTEDMLAGPTPADDDAKLGVNSDALMGDASPIPTDAFICSVICQRPIWKS